MSLLDDLLNKPIAPVVQGRKVGEKDYTAKLEVSGDTAEVVIRKPAGEEAEESTARAYLEQQGLDPSLFEVSSFKRSEWGSADSPMQSTSYTFRRIGSGSGPSVNVEELYEVVRKHKPAKKKPPAGSHGFVFGIGDQQFGKALSDGTPVLTTDGWCKHGDLRPGMKVFGRDGKPATIRAVTGSTMQELFAVTFGDGTSIVASGDHLWSGTRRMHPTDYRRNPDAPDWETRSMVLSTAEIAAICRQAGGAARPFTVDAASPVEMPVTELPVDPYLFGLWLGDGHSGTGIISKGSVDREMLEPWGREVPSNSRGGAMYSVRVPGLTAALRKLGVLGCKRIPEAYLMASVEQRLALVQGLMDTDGHAAESGHCEFTNTSEPIIEGMKFLLHSLGVRFTIGESVGNLYGVDKKPYWRMTFRSDLPVFRLPRKLERVRPALKRAGARRSVVSVEPVGMGMAQCITVDGGLYLAGEHLTVTHNCDGDGAEGALQRCIQYIDLAAAKLGFYRDAGYDIGHVHLAWMGDHIEGFVSQGGANVWRTPLTLNEQIRLVRRVMLYAMQVFAPLAPRLTMAAVPGNHGEPVRFEGKGVTRYDDSHDTESLIAVSDAAQLNREAFGHVEFYVPDTDELIVMLDVAGTMIAHHHGHKWTPNKHFDWWKGQAFNRDSAMHLADVLLTGHLHHEHLERDGKRLFIGLPAVESESTWFRHAKGTGGCPGAMVLITKDGQVGPIEFIR